MRDNGEISDYSKDVIRKLIDDGYFFTIASARSLVSIKRLFSDVPLKLPVISYNGAVISHVNSRDYETINSIDVGIFDQVMEVVESLGLEPFVSTYAQTAEHRYFRKIRNEGMEYVVQDFVEKHDRRLLHVKHFEEARHEPILEFNVIGTLEETDEFYKKLFEKVGTRVNYVRFESRYSPGWHWVSLASPVVSKASGCEKIIKENGFSSKDLIVFGDEDNDVKMFEYAGRPIAVSNAINSIKKLASEVIGSNNDDAVAKYLDKNFLKN